MDLLRLQQENQTDELKHGLVTLCTIPASCHMVGLCKYFKDPEKTHSLMYNSGNGTHL
jgi:hypothetical protein